MSDKKNVPKIRFPGFTEPLHQRELIFAFITKEYNTSVSGTSVNYINVTNLIK